MVKGVVNDCPAAFTSHVQVPPCEAFTGLRGTLLSWMGEPSGISHFTVELWSELCTSHWTQASLPSWRASEGEASTAKQSTAAEEMMQQWHQIKNCAVLNHSKFIRILKNDQKIGPIWEITFNGKKQSVIEIIVLLKQTFRSLDGQ